VHAWATAHRTHLFLLPLRSCKTRSRMERSGMRGSKVPDYASLRPGYGNGPKEIPMYKASAGVMLPTSIIGSLPRPSWHNAALRTKGFLEAMLNARYREQYEDAVSSHLRAQETAGLDICTDGDAHYDEEVGGMSWQSYPLTHMA